jgi:hypothetical protein
MPGSGSGSGGGSGNPTLQSLKRAMGTSFGSVCFGALVGGTYCHLPLPLCFFFFFFFECQQATAIATFFFFWFLVFYSQTPILKHFVYVKLFKKNTIVIPKILIFICKNTSKPPFLYVKPPNNAFFPYKTPFLYVKIPFLYPKPPFSSYVKPPFLYLKTPFLYVKSLQNPIFPYKTPPKPLISQVIAAIKWLRAMVRLAMSSSDNYFLRCICNCLFGMLERLAEMFNEMAGVYIAV